MTTSDTRRRVEPRRSVLPRDVAMQLAATEYGRLLDLLADLGPEDWSLRTDCTEWDVRELAAHNLGMAEMAASMRENLRQNAAARRRGGVFIHALTGLQVEERRGMTPAALVERYAEVGPLAARGRRRTPGIVRRTAMPGTQPVGGSQERWTFGFLVDTILTRDTWMHRIDIARATRRDLVLTADHDGVLVGDVVAEWATRHGSPCTLTLTGPAGGRWSFGTGGPELELDAVEFCRIVSRRSPSCADTSAGALVSAHGDGRPPGAGLLDVHVPF
jgi:uncharacterized protein (TIGR03083 family)